MSRPYVCSNLFVAFGLLFCSQSWAINKCIDGKGKTVYQEAACPDTHETRGVNTSGAGKGDPGSAGAQYWTKQVEEVKRKSMVDEAVHNRKIFIGMTSAEVTRSWGRPTKINTTIQSGTRSAQWVYRDENPGGSTQYVYLENGVVRSMQTEGE